MDCRRVARERPGKGPEVFQREAVSGLDLSQEKGWASESLMLKPKGSRISWAAGRPLSNLPVV